MAEGLNLDGMPRRHWADRIWLWDFLVRMGRLPRLMERVSGGVRAAASSDGSQILDELAAAAVHRGGLDAAVQLCDDFSDHAHHRYTLTVRQGDTNSLSANLRDLHKALASIPNLPSLIGRTAVLVVLQGCLAAEAWGMAPSVLRIGWWWDRPP